MYNEYGFKDYELDADYPTTPFASIEAFETFICEHAIGMTKWNYEDFINHFANDYFDKFGIDLYE